MRARVCCKKKKKKNKKNAGSAFAANYTFAKNPHEIMAPSLPPFHFSGKIGEAIFLPFEMAAIPKNCPFQACEKLLYKLSVRRYIWKILIVYVIVTFYKILLNEIFLDIYKVSREIGLILFKYFNSSDRE